jgi:spore germination cell wall hydrolase CwlJ-like protein
MLKRTLLGLGLALATPATTKAQDLSPRQMECLSRAIYFEARNQSFEGQFAVAWVVLSRMRHPAFPRTMCDVIHQRRGSVCQFSWTCTALRSARPRNVVAWQQAQQIARFAVQQPVDTYPQMLYFHARRQPFRWRHLTEVAEIQDHIFYGDRR